MAVAAAVRPTTVAGKVLLSVLKAQVSGARKRCGQCTEWREGKTEGRREEAKTPR